MDLFDSNVWIWALTHECIPAEELVDTLVAGERWVAVSPYIFEEVIQNLARADQRQAVIDRAQTRFAEIVHGNQHVIAPAQDAVAACDLESVRTAPHHQLIASQMGIQAKDAPIFSIAHHWAQKHPSKRPGGDTVTIYTADRSFSQFDAESRFDSIEMRYVNC
ncbi:MAG: hypothetical protein ABEI77_09975 [Halorientalis sp.]